MDPSGSNLLDRISAINPLPDGAQADQATADHLRNEIVSAPRFHAAGPPRRSRRVVAAAVAVAVAAIAAPALATSDDVRSFFRGDEPLAVLDQSRLVVVAPVGEGKLARVWEAPARAGGECSFTTVGPEADRGKPNEMGSGICGPASADLQRSTTVSVTVDNRPDAAADLEKWVPPLVEGYLDPALGATSVEVRWTGGSKKLAYSDGRFIGSVEELYNAGAEMLPIQLVARGAQGQEVHQGEIPAQWFRLG